MSTIYISPEEQEQVAKGLHLSNDAVTAIHNLRSKTGQDHLGRVSMPLSEFAQAVKPHFPHHIIQSHIKTITGHDIHLDKL